jgi:hypothetical protein
MMGVTAAGPGLVVVGSVGRAPAVWTASDGTQWRLISLWTQAGGIAAALQKVAAQRNVIVATGTATSRAGTVPFAEYSTDGGRAW